MSEMTDAALMETGADALVDELQRGGVEYVFANVGTDYPAIIEAFARRRAAGLPTPKVVLCQHEVVAIAAAAGYAQATGRVQAVFVHVDVGTANLGGMLHNVNRGHIGVVIISGQSPWTTNGELPGSRSNPVQYWQDIPDQMGIVRPYTRWSYEVKTALNVRQLVRRALRVAGAPLGGPVYLMAAREPLAQEVAVSESASPRDYRPVQTVPAPEAMDTLAGLIRDAQAPLIVTSYLGRDPLAVPALVEFAEDWAVPVVEVSSDVLNFPRDHELHAGSDAAALLPGADLIVVLDCDMPWLPLRAQAGPRSRVVHVDADVEKLDIGLIDVEADLVVQASGAATLRALRERLHEERSSRAEQIRQRRHRVRRAGRDFRANLVATPTQGPGIAPRLVAEALGRLLDEDAILMDESISSQKYTRLLTGRNRPGTYFGPGGSSLGWGLGAGLGAKLAHPERDVVVAVADGAFVFGAPSAVYWGARKYGAAFLTVVFNNSAWEAVEIATAEQYPGGTAVAQGEFMADLTPNIDLVGVAAASGGAWGVRVEDAAHLDEALSQALEQVRAGIPAVVEVRVQVGSR
ncbi:thiamine pyrophosphate-requiring protein [Streptomyces sp. SID8352]|uniref:thiamine pyrophosphate-requiring protein n=1 Tax=Streptomyces sp. SID8352 TaxID=2690338 RepID=UPI00136D888C|nr:thiamine pyrophosphate-requiring protein [Streptomyces sp. SID8352]MYU22591.1 thiamine pyrophosphate-requiring protein [Streptomyces sp. SID8352]